MSPPSMLRKPLLGGPFGNGQYELATQPTITNGLHAVRFTVIEPRAGRVLSIAETKVDALAGARRVLRGQIDADGAEQAWYQPRLWSDADLAVIDADPPPRPVSRRRREVFESSGGLCHYCRAPLTLDGQWHVEHQMPRALGGTDDAANLVAACAPCNLAKGDRTAVEFVFHRGLG